MLQILTYWLHQAIKILMVGKKVVVLGALAEITLLETDDHKSYMVACGAAARLDVLSKFRRHPHHAEKIDSLEIDTMADQACCYKRIEALSRYLVTFLLYSLDDLADFRHGIITCQHFS